MAKKLIAIVKLVLQANKATPAPPIGPALGQYGLNIINFCKEYNTKTSEMGNLIIPVQIFVFEDKSFSFFFKTQPTSILLREAANINKGSVKPNNLIVGSITLDQIKNIALIKLPDLNTNNLSIAIKIVQGTAKNMGITISKN